MEVLKGLDGNLRVLQDDYIIASQEATLKPGTLRRAIPRTSVYDRALNGRVLHRRNDKPTSIGETDHSENGVHEDVIRVRCQPSRRQRAWWNAVHDASNRGVPVWGIARQLSISRNTVRKYLAAEGPDLGETVARSTYSPSVTIGNVTNRHNR